MAEIAGLALGAVGVIGVIGAFKDTIDLFQTFSGIKNSEWDYEVLSTKLDIEKTLLLQWSDRVRLLEHDHDVRLNNRNTQDLVLRVLACIQRLMSNSSALQTLYGLLDISGGDDIEEDTVPRTVTLSTPRMAQFSREFHSLRSRVAASRPKMPFVKRGRWVIRDKQKFEGLVDELASFTWKLSEIIPPINNQATTKSMAIDDLATVRSVKGLKMLLEAAAVRHTDITEAVEGAIDDRCKKRILSRLWFRRMHERRDGITQAHHKTLQWALEAPDSSVPWDSLCEWFRSDSSIYWISGKAGSGKSTLMKYLYTNEYVKGLLSDWAGNSPCFMSDFFFWYLGTPEQKSLEGLSRALLHQILSIHLSLIPEVLPGMWKELYENEQDPSFPTPIETMQAFDVLAKKSREIGKICFFIDGLDEFIGDQKEGIEFIKKLAINSQVKIIVSSRPIPDCVAAYNEGPKLRLQDLTRKDISSYVQDTIGDHTYMKKLLKRHPLEATAILNDLIEKSSGVFLWVILACRSLLDGFAHFDRITELRRCVDDLPQKLEDMFQDMLHKVENRHEEQCSVLMRLCYAYQKGRGQYQVNDMLTLGIALAADHPEYPPLKRSMTIEERHDVCEELEGRLRSRCGGLLEVRKISDPSICLCEGTPFYHKCDDQHDYQVDSQVVFMHRTVFEFLSSEHVWNLECLAKVPDDFNADAALSMSNLHLALQALRDSSQRRAFKSGEQAAAFFRDALIWAAKVDKENPDYRITALWQMRAFFDALPKPGNTTALTLQRLSMAHTHTIPEFSHANLLVAIEADAVNYVKNYPLLRVWATKRPCNCPSLLYQAISQFGFRLVEKRTPISKDMAKVLLSSGCHPNGVVNHHARRTTAWRVWLQEVQLGSIVYPEKTEALDIAESFLKAGADSDDLEQWLTTWCLEDDSNTDTLVQRRAAELLQLVKDLRAPKPSRRRRKR